MDRRHFLKLASAAVILPWPRLSSDPKGWEFKDGILSRSRIITDWESEMRQCQAKVGRIISTRTLISEEPIPRSMELPTGDDCLWGCWGWHKDFASVEAISCRPWRWKLKQQWRFGFWHTALYGEAL